MYFLRNIAEPKVYIILVHKLQKIISNGHSTISLGIEKLH